MPLKVVSFPLKKKVLNPERLEIRYLMNRLRRAVDKSRNRNISMASALGCIEALKAELIEEYLEEKDDA